MIGSALACARGKPSSVSGQWAWPLTDGSFEFAADNKASCPLASGICPLRPRRRDGFDTSRGSRSGSASALSWQKGFPGVERELGAMRRWLASVLPDCPSRDDVASVATELAANAIQHTTSGLHGWFQVEVTRRGRLVRVAVADGGAPGVPRLVDDPLVEHGRGLVIVAALSLRMGSCGNEGGRLVWADVPWDGQSPSSPLAHGRAPCHLAIVLP